MKLIRMVVLCLATSCAAFAQSTNPEIPAGVNYKLASDEVNAAAKALLEKALEGDKAASKRLLAETVTCGPTIWHAIKPAADAKLLGSKELTLVLSTPKPLPFEGRGLITDEQRDAFWTTLLKQYPGLKAAKVRKAQAREISYFWSTIFFDIEEPFFAIDDGSHVFIANLALKNGQPVLSWFDLVGDLQKLAPRAVSNETEKAIVGELANQVETKDPATMLRLGKAYLTGNSAEQDVERGRALLDGAAQKGVLEAQLLLGFSYFSGKYLPQDYAKAAPYLKQAAEQGNAMAQYYVGSMYFKGLGLEKSVEKAVPFFEKAADQNFASAQYHLGAIYFQGIGVAPDKARGCALYLKGAEQGHLESVNDLGWCYQLGDGMPKDPSKAMTLYTRAAEAGHLTSQGNLAMMYAASEQWDKAYIWLRIAENGGAGAQARSILESVKSHLTPMQIDQAEIKVVEWQKAHPKKP